MKSSGGSLIVVHDITGMNWHLMPWRTVVEVVRHQRHEDRFVLLSLSEQEGEAEITGLPVPAWRVCKRSPSLANSLAKVLRESEIGTVYWPFTWREPAKRLKMVSELADEVVCWMPGGEYRLESVLYSIRRVGLRPALPYIVESLFPKRLQVSRLKRFGVSAMLTMTGATAKVATAAGWPSGRVTVIPPGREGHHDDVIADGVADFDRWLSGRRFFLFAGPPSAIRGIYELLEAFELLAESNGEACLVCLFRSDAVLDSEDLKSKIARMASRDRVYTVWESVSKDVLSYFMSTCHAIVLPFVLVPSEIPLAIIECMRYGKPVITTSNGGTGEYVADCGRVVELGNIRAMAAAMSELYSDDEAYARIASLTLAKYASHISWAEMSAQWGALARCSQVPQ